MLGNHVDHGQVLVLFALIQGKELIQEKIVAVDQEMRLQREGITQGKYVGDASGETDLHLPMQHLIVDQG